MKNVVLYVCLAKYDNEQSDLIHRIESEKLLEEIPKYKAVVEKFTTNEIISQAAFCDSFEKKLTDLKARIVEHNIRMMAKYYTKIRLTRMAKLLALTEAQTEDCLSEMVVAGTVSAKTDRLEGIIDFTELQDPLENLNSWSSNTNKLMDLVMKATHLINKEEMVHKHLAGGATE